MAAVPGLIGRSLWNMFTAKAELVGAGVVRTASEDAAATLLGEATSEFVCTASVARRYPKLVGRAATPPSEVVAPAAFAVAETGSIALDEPATDRGMCFLAERLWILVNERDIVPTIDVAIQRMRDLVRGGSRHPLLMTGPSRTADIERVLTIGVHGPGALMIVVIDQR